MLITGAQFRIILVLHVIAGVVGIGVGLFESNGFPPALAEAYAELPDSWIFEGFWLSLCLFGLLFAVTIAEWIGLFLFKRWARSLACWTTVIFCLLLLFDGPVLMSSLENTCYEISNILLGAVLALAYCSPISARFER